MKVMILGDSPRISTGFGTVNSVAAGAFLRMGWEVACVSGLTQDEPPDDGIKTYVPKERGDMLGLLEIPGAIEDFKPDITYMTGDPGSCTMIAMNVPDMPAFMYVPIEGQPIVNQDWRRLLSGIPVMTCSKYGVDLVKRELGRDIDYVYHGVNHETFRVTGNREQTRHRMGWDGKFVITAVTTNVRRKQIPRLIAAVSMLKKMYNQKDIILYLHTVPFQNYFLEGWKLPEVVAAYDVWDEVQFPVALQKRNDSVPPDELAELYNASDLFVNPSQVEGFGLPIAEAMACGVPVLVTKYAAGWEVASPAGRGIEPYDWEVHKSGTLYANVDPHAMAKEILRLKRAPKERQRMSEAGLIRAQDFQWSAFEEKLLEGIQTSYDGYQERRAQNQGEDQGQEEGHETVGVRTEEALDSDQASGSGLEGQGEVAPSQETTNRSLEPKEEA